MSGKIAAAAIVTVVLGMGVAYGIWYYLSEPCPSRPNFTCEQEMRDITIPTVVAIIVAFSVAAIPIWVVCCGKSNESEYVMEHNFMNHNLPPPNNRNPANPDLEEWP